MTVVDDDEEAGYDVDGPPEGTNTCHDVCFLVSLAYLLAERLCPYTPPLTQRSLQDSRPPLHASPSHLALVVPLIGMLCRT